MGMNKTNLSEVLFSKTQRRVLGLLFGNPDRSYYANEIVHFAGTSIGTVRRELERLAANGLLTVTRSDNQKHYQANRQSPIFEELRGIVLKMFGVADVLREALAPFTDRIRTAFIYGSVAKGTDTASSDIDVMVVADDLSYSDIFSSLAQAESRLGRTVNPAVYGQTELCRKPADDNAFLSRVSDQPKIFLAGSNDDLPEPGKSGTDR